MLMFLSDLVFFFINRQEHSKERTWINRTCDLDMKPLLYRWKRKKIGAAVVQVFFTCPLLLQRYLSSRVNCCLHLHSIGQLDTSVTVTSCRREMTLSRAERYTFPKFGAAVRNTILIIEQQKHKTWRSYLVLVLHRHVCSAGIRIGYTLSVSLLQLMFLFPNSFLCWAVTVNAQP